MTDICGEICVVFDTNCLLDFWIFKDSRFLGLFEAVKSRKLRAIYSQETLDELADVVARYQFKQTSEDIEKILAEWTSLASKTEVNSISPVWCTDPLDQKFFDLALAGKAQWLITKDKAVLKANKKAMRTGLRILKPEVAWRELQSISAQDGR